MRSGRSLAVNRFFWPAKARFDKHPLSRGALKCKCNKRFNDQANGFVGAAKELLSELKDDQTQKKDALSKLLAEAEPKSKPKNGQRASKGKSTDCA